MRKKLSLIFIFALFSLFNLFVVTAWADGAIWLNKDIKSTNIRYLETLPIQFTNDFKGAKEAWESSLVDQGRKNGYQIDKIASKNNISSMADAYIITKITNVKNEKTWAEGYSMQVHMVRRFEMSDTKGRSRSWEIDNGYRTHTVSGCDVYTNEVEVEYCVYDPITNNLIFTYQNSLAGSSNTNDLFRTLTKDFYKELKRLLQNKK